MEEQEPTTYERLDGRGGNLDPSGSPEMEAAPPKDHRHFVYLALLTAGIGFVLPYNSFIIASDYWQNRFPNRHVALDMSMTYIIVAFATVLLNNVFLSFAPFEVRIAFGYIISFSTLIFVAICEVAWHIFETTTAYTVNLTAISLVAMGCTVQQSSFYGFASMLPKQYTQAVMAGESLAGFLVSSNRVLTKALIKSDRISTVLFFLASTVYVGLSCVLHTFSMNRPFVRYHMKACAKIVLRPDEDRGLTEPNDSDMPPANYGGSGITTDAGFAQNPMLTDKPSHKYSSITLDAMIAPAPILSFDNPVYEISNPSAGQNSLGNTNDETDTIVLPHDVPNVAYKVEHVLTPGSCNPGRLGNFKNGLESRWRVAHAIYPYMVCIALAYCVTLSLYPGIESEIKSCNLGTWMPVLLMFTFNTSDVLGKILAAVPYSWTRRQLILMSGLRVICIPLLLLCCAPRQNPTIAGETAPFIFSAALGVTNGLAGSLPMMLAPAKVPATLKEVTGNMMTLSYNVGLTCGSLIGYVFDSMLGEPIDLKCPVFPYVALNNQSSLITTIPPMPTVLTTLAALTTSMLPTTTSTTTVSTTTNLSIISDITSTASITSSEEITKLFTTLATSFILNTNQTTAFNLSTITSAYETD